MYIGNYSASCYGCTKGFPWALLWFLIGALVVCRIGAHIPVPGIDPAQLAQLFKQNQGGILGMFNMFSGGALSRFTIFALGIMPYISASIIMQRSEEHTSELQSLMRISYAVFCLKKKTKTKPTSR